MTIRLTDPEIGSDSTDPEIILRALPQWFGIEDAIQHYVESISQMPTICAYRDDQMVGFLSIKLHNPSSAEIYVMGVAPQYHRQGIGNALVLRSESYLKAQRIEFLQVKTLSATHPDPHYAKTRKFYLALGFRPLEEFPTLWGESNPCLLMIKTL